jgi:hypothetical protein
LTAGLVQNVDQMSLHIQKAKLKHGKQPHRACSNNNNISFDCLLRHARLR